MIYPPILKSTQPAFSIASLPYAVSFSLPAYVAYGDIGHLQIRIVKQANNQSIVNTTPYPDGIIYKLMPNYDSSGIYSVYINSSDLSQTWTEGTVYKIQMRFGTSGLWGDRKNFATWKQTQIANQTFSEWSTVMIVKAITPPTVAISNAAAGSDDSSTQYLKTTTPLFQGTYLSSSANNEAADKYVFDLYDDDDNLIESSGELQYSGDSSMQHRFKTVLVEDGSYIVRLTVTTVNGYVATAPDYRFIVRPLQLEELSGIDFYTLDTDAAYNERNGCVKFYLNTDDAINGNYVITRSDETSNFSVWEDIKYFVFRGETLESKAFFTDFTIESGVQYKYAIQSENSKKLRSAPLYSKSYTDESKGSYIKNAIHEVHFEYSYLYRDGLQLRLQFDQRMNSFKHTVLRSKQDTLGGRFPHLANNGYAYYAEFPLNGLITLQADQDQTFFTWKSDGLYCGDSLVAPARMFEDRDGSREYTSPEDVPEVTKPWTHKDGYEFGDNVYAYHDDEIASSEHRGSSDHPVASDIPAAASSSAPDGTISTDLTRENIYIERKVREKVEEWLNSFNYKLYKSPTEGNIVIGLLNVSLVPKQELGRMIFEFSATAYELAENTIESLNNVGIIDIGSQQSVVISTTISAFGQIDELYQSGTDIYALADAQQTVDIGAYSYRLDQITSIWLDRYPVYLKSDIDSKIDISKLVYEIETLKSELAEAKKAGDEEEIARLEAEIAKEEAFEAFFENNKINTYEGITRISVNDKEIIMMPGRVYQVDENISSLKLVSTDYPVVLNYTCDLQIKSNVKRKETSAINNSVVWGQISGVFTETPSVLRSYNYGYAGLRPYRVYTPGTTEIAVTEQDATNYNVYNTKDILAAIKDEVRKQIEYKYDTTFEYDETDGWNDGKVYYSLTEFTNYSIEADPGTVVNVNGANVTLGRVMLADEPLLRREPGMTPIFENDTIVGYQYAIGHYSAEGDLQRLSIESPQFIIVNYRCKTQEQIKEAVGEGDE